MNKIIKWLLKKTYHREIKAIIEIIDLKNNQIKNLKERITYLNNHKIYDERKYR